MYILPGQKIRLFFVGCPKAAGIDTGTSFVKNKGVDGGGKKCRTENSRVKRDEEKLEFEGRSIRFSVVRSRRRRKTLAISLHPPDSVVVKVPFRLSRERIREAVRSRAAWIFEKQKVLDGLRPPPRKFLDGDGLPFLGRVMILELVKRNGPEARAFRGRLQVFLGDAVSVSGQSREERIRAALTSWYSAQAEKRIRRRVSLYAKKMGLDEPTVIIRAQRTRWGSCDSKDCLRFNWRLVMAPLSVLDYVVVHELCHLRHKDHAVDFWSCLRAILPDYEARKRRLRREGLKYHL